MEPVIEIQQLNHYFGKGVLRKPVLSDIDLSIYRGEVVILMGPSGSGKTTLLTNLNWSLPMNQRQPLIVIPAEQSLH